MQLATKLSAASLCNATWDTGKRMAPSHTCSPPLQSNNNLLTTSGNNTYAPQMSLASKPSTSKA